MSDIEEYQPLFGQKKNKRSTLQKYGYYIATGVVLFTASLFLGHFVYESNVQLDSPVEFVGHIAKGTKGAVAVEAEQCSNIGVEILKKGGNAVDAAIASNLCIGVIDTFATGIGGGGFMLIRSPNGTFEFIDFRETAPAGATEDMFVKDPMLAQHGGLSVAVPHGKLPWHTLFEPSIHLAREGFKSEQGWMSNLTEWTDIYYKNGRPAKAGEIIKSPRLADTLESVAKYGADAFYEGKIAESLVEKIQSSGGIVTLDDFKGYTPVIRPTISTFYNGRKVITTSEPTSGRVLISVLNLIERFQFKVEGLTGLNVHRLIEALKFGAAFRTELADPDFIDNRDRKDELGTKDYAATIRQKITDDKTHDVLYYGPKFDNIESHGTMHLSVVDENDGAVALTSTVNLMFGSHLLDERTGVVLNDQMDDFSIPGTPNKFGLYPSKYNYIAPKKRPLSSITPVIIERDGLLEMVLGGSGGSLIPTATLHAIINVLEYGKDVYSAVASPRVHHQLMPNMVIAERGFDKRIEKELIKRNHTIFRLPSKYCVSAVQIVKRNEDGTIEAASDPRKMGLAAAY
ncbi:Putative Gamma-glutamyltransferase [Rhizopus microsporus]|nr:Putative Gamma-glutamyltransferase [Rhizopus microsporus]